MVRISLIDEFKGHGVTEGTVIDMFLQAFTMAQTKGNARVMREVAGDFRDMLEMNPDPRAGRLDPYRGTDIQDAEIVGDEKDVSGVLADARRRLPTRKAQAPAVVPDPPSA